MKKKEKIKRYTLFVLLIFFMSYQLLFSQEVLKEPIWVYYGRGNRYLHDKKYGYSLAEYKKALTKINKVMKNTGTMSLYLPDVSLKIAQVYFIENLYDASLFYLNIVEKNESLFQIPDRIYTALYLKADNLLKLKKMDKVIEQYNYIINKDNNWNNYKSLRADQMPDFIDSPEKKAKFGYAYYKMGKIKYESGNYENAITYLRMAFLYKYKINKTITLLQNCYQKLGKDFMIEKISKMISNKKQ